MATRLYVLPINLLGPLGVPHLIKCHYFQLIRSVMDIFLVFTVVKT